MSANWFCLCVSLQDDELLAKAEEAYKESLSCIRADGWKLEKQSAEGDLIHSKVIRCNRKIFRITVSKPGTFSLSIPSVFVIFNYLNYGTFLVLWCCVMVFFFAIELHETGHCWYSTTTSLRRATRQHRKRSFLESDLTAMPHFESIQFQRSHARPWIRSILKWLTEMITSHELQIFALRRLRLIA